MIELKRTGEGTVELLHDGQSAGGARWSLESLCWGREKIRVARLTGLEAEAEDAADLWAYLEFLWEPMAVAAVRMPDGTLRWRSKALEASWRAAGAPEG